MNEVCGNGGLLWYGGCRVSFGRVGAGDGLFAAECLEVGCLGSECLGFLVFLLLGVLVALGGFVVCGSPIVTGRSENLTLFRLRVVVRGVVVASGLSVVKVGGSGDLVFFPRWVVI